MKLYALSNMRIKLVVAITWLGDEHFVSKHTKVRKIGTKGGKGFVGSHFDGLMGCKVPQ